MMKIVIVGSGNISLRHSLNIKKLLPTADLALLTSEERLTSYKKKQFNIMSRFLFNRQEVINYNPIAVLICSPAPMHVNEASFYASMGINVFIEKPLSNTLDNISNLDAIVNDKGIIAMVGYVLRFNKALNVFWFY